jgi:hypothetical protein
VSNTARNAYGWLALHLRIVTDQWQLDRVKLNFHPSRPQPDSATDTKAHPRMCVCVCVDRGSGLISYANEANIPTARKSWTKWYSGLAQHTACCAVDFVLLDKLGVSAWFLQLHHCVPIGIQHNNIKARNGPSNATVLTQQVPHSIGVIG